MSKQCSQTGHGLGDGLGLEDGLGLWDRLGLGLGDRLRLALGLGDGDGLGLGLGLDDGDGLGDGLGPGLRESLGLGIGSQHEVRASTLTTSSWPSGTRCSLSHSMGASKNHTSPEPSAAGFQARFARAISRVFCVKKLTQAVLEGPTSSSL